ncbi:MAG: 4-hydroxy-tetrahydrodipicolinate synthase [Terriglobales bacterium]
MKGKSGAARKLPAGGDGGLFVGCGTALITPFRGDGGLDEKALRRFVRWQIDEGIDFLVPGGTTGESPTLSREEHLRVVEITLEEARRARRVPVLAGAGGNNTAAVIELARAVERLGAEGILSVAPYYNKPTQEGLYRHYAAIAAAVQLPIVLYNVPGRTGSNVEPATVARLAKIANIAGIKEASGSVAQMSEVLAAVPPDFCVLSGDDALALSLIALGGRGVVSVASNEIPGPMTEMMRLALAGDFAAARQLHFRYWPLLTANFVESNPIPVKAALARMGFCQEVYRLPLAPISPAGRAKLELALAAAGVGAGAMAVR